jgi:hydroxymethylbilane synthase
MFPVSASVDPARPAPAGAVRIGTRRSALALHQARMVQQALAALGVAGVLVTFDTLGDQILDRPLSALGAKGLFTAELEAALRAGAVDVCVHSLKDLPTQFPPDLAALAVLPRADPRDVLVGPAGAPAPALDRLPAGARVGTCSLRRRALLRAHRPDVAVLDLRGNVPTRLAKVDAGGYDAIVLAAAGLLRLGLGERVGSWLDAPAWLPAPGQGAVAVQARTGDARTGPLLAALHDAPTGVAVAAERALLGALEGGCQVPVGALTVSASAGPVLHGVVADVDGGRVVRGEEFVDPRSPEAAGAALARRLLRLGADAILADVRAAAVGSSAAIFGAPAAGAPALALR